eukprot:9469793-Pyramimonas_sp.AAC.1
MRSIDELPEGERLCFDLQTYWAVRLDPPLGVDCGAINQSSHPRAQQEKNNNAAGGWGPARGHRRSDDNRA